MSRLVFVQVFFAGGKRRAFLLGIRPIRKSQVVVPSEGMECLVGSFASELLANGIRHKSAMEEFASKGGRWLVGIIGEEMLDERAMILEGDLRNPKHAEIVAQALAG
jgi:hypothetical protein